MNGCYLGAVSIIRFLDYPMKKPWRMRHRIIEDVLYSKLPKTSVIKQKFKERKIKTNSGPWLVGHLYLTNCNYVNLNLTQDFSKPLNPG